MTGTRESFDGPCDAVVRVWLAINFWVLLFATPISGFIWMAHSFASKSAVHLEDRISSVWPAFEWGLIFCGLASSCILVGFMRRHLAGQRRIVRAIEDETAALNSP